MNKNNKNTHSSQRNINRYKQIEEAQKEWYRLTEQFVKDKKELGYEAFAWDAFLLLSPDALLLDDERKKSIADLQEHYKSHIAEQERLWTEDFVIDELNKRHAIIHTDQTYVLTEKINALNNYDFILESRQSFKALYENQLVLSYDSIWRSKAEIWLKSPKRRTYYGMIFDPATTDPVNDRYNLWKGFKRRSQKGNCALYWLHVHGVICGDNEELYQYVRKWLALIVQHPDRLHTALVLCGSQGVGKNSFVDPIGELFGPHYTVLSSMGELVSNFNYHLKYATLIHANEALWGGHKKDIGTVKAMITDATYLIEGKGKDRIMVPNFRHIIISSNESWPVHIDPDDRRFVVIQVSDAHKEDHAYFKAIQMQLNNGGYEALLYDLLNEDLTNFNPRKLPVSNRAFDIKMLSADSAERYIFNVLFEGGFSIGILDEKESPCWQGTIAKENVYKDYGAWTQKNGEKCVSNSIFGKILKRCIPSIEDTKPGGTTRVYSYNLPSLQQARMDFCKQFKCDYEQVFGPRIGRE